MSASDFDEASQWIRKRILQRLNELGWSQTYVARQMGVTPQNIYGIISGTRKNISLKTIVRFQKVLGVQLLSDTKQ